MRFGIREVVFLVLLLSLPVGAYVLVFQDRTEQIEQAREEIKRKQDKLAELEAATMAIPDLGQEIDRLSAAIARIEEMLPDERKIDEVLKQVWELASRQSLKPKSIRTDKPLPAAQYSELPIQLEIVGDFDGFYQFLIDLEKLPRIMRMPTMKLEKLKDKDRAEGQMKATVTLSVFFDGPVSGPAKAVGRPRL